MDGSSVTNVFIRNQMSLSLNPVLLYSYYVPKVKRKLFTHTYFVLSILFSNVNIECTRHPVRPKGKGGVLLKKDKYTQITKKN